VLAIADRLTSKEDSRDRGGIWSPPSRLLSVAPQDEVKYGIKILK
jgi:hypothetical protein